MNKVSVPMEESLGLPSVVTVRLEGRNGVKIQEIDNSQHKGLNSFSLNFLNLNEDWSNLPIIVKIDFLLQFLL